MTAQLEQLFDSQGGVATSGQILAHIPRRSFERQLDTGVFDRVWHGVYCRGEVNDELRLRALDLAAGTPVATCLGTAAALFGFDTEDVADMHVLNPDGHLLRNQDGLRVHRREGEPLITVGGRPVTAPAWTAIEVARGLRRPRALATLDAALRSGTCDRTTLWTAAYQQAGRRGITIVRDLIDLAAGKAESPMESEARLAMVDGGLPQPTLQYEILDGDGLLRRVDFAWPEARLAVEYDGLDWHSSPEAMKHDRKRQAALQDVGWTVIAIVFEDVRYRSWDFVGRIDRHLNRAAA